MEIKYIHFRVPSFVGVNLPKNGKVKHADTFRYSRSSPHYFKPYERGGATVCGIYRDDGVLLGKGLAICSMSDNFCYKTGRDLAFSRAVGC